MNKHLLFIASLGLLLGLNACKSTKPLVQNQGSVVATPVAEVVKYEHKTQMQIKQLKAIDLEEDWTFADELVLNYTLTAVDSNQQIVQVVNGSWGVESVKQGQIILADKFKPIELTLPENGKVLASVVLTEIEDYQKAQAMVKKINDLGGIAKIPAVLVSIAEYQTPIAIVFGSLQAAGLGLKAAEHFDKDDLLGQNTFQITFDEVKAGKTLFAVPLVFKGEHLKNTFHYELNYDLKVKILPLKN
ncbi:hypothetical protein [Flectobacillus major]|jgi:hypothetical protein|uniref:hypothetical protein n=1 Tax=Flectobacillus major TaxID=103 RepID=UPI0004071FF7|nr:hypothetical protein [Flectobacillus major]